MNRTQIVRGEVNKSWAVGEQTGDGQEVYRI